MVWVNYPNVITALELVENATQTLVSYVDSFTVSLLTNKLTKEDGRFDSTETAKPVNFC